jgi:putative aldouronate transport system permease protein
VGQWNSWFDTFLYASSNKSLSTLQYELQKILQSVSQTMTQTPDLSGAAQRAGSVTPMSIRASMTIVAVAPIIMVYPFLQKYFVKGMTLGGVKG